MSDTRVLKWHCGAVVTGHTKQAHHHIRELSCERDAPRGARLCFVVRTSLTHRPVALALIALPLILFYARIALRAFALCIALRTSLRGPRFAALASCRHAPQTAAAISGASRSYLPPNSSWCMMTRPRHRLPATTFMFTQTGACSAGVRCSCPSSREDRTALVHRRVCDAQCVAHAGKCCLCERLSSPVFDEDDDGVVLAIAFDRPWALVGASLCETETRRPPKRRETKHATGDITMAERRRRTLHVAERRSKTTCGAVSRNCRMARSPVGACRIRPCAKLPLLPPPPQQRQKKSCNRIRSQPRDDNERWRCERRRKWHRGRTQRTAAAGDGKRDRPLFKPFFLSVFVCVFMPNANK